MPCWKPGLEVKGSKEPNPWISLQNCRFSKFRAACFRSFSCALPTISKACDASFEFKTSFFKINPAAVKRNSTISGLGAGPFFKVLLASSGLFSRICLKAKTAGLKVKTSGMSLGSGSSFSSTGVFATSKVGSLASKVGPLASVGFSKIGFSEINRKGSISLLAIGLSSVFSFLASSFSGSGSGGGGMLKGWALLAANLSLASFSDLSERSFKAGGRSCTFKDFCSLGESESLIFAAAVFFVTSSAIARTLVGSLFSSSSETERLSFATGICTRCILAWPKFVQPLAICK